MTRLVDGLGIDRRCGASSLLTAIDHTKTAMGKRFLRMQLLQPSTVEQTIQKRQLLIQCTDDLS